MLFNSIEFAFFLPIVFVFYWFVSKGYLRIQNFILLAASLYFYACWDYRFLSLLGFSIVFDYFIGIKIYNTGLKSGKQFWFWLSIVVNIGFLGVFKYYNFFVHSFVSSLSFFGVKANISTLQLILPVGISFYTFHGLSYLIDIYKDRISPERNFVNYALFVSYFPLLVAGPIERATHLIPQIDRKREFDYTKAVDGLRQILWGLFKKIVVADNCAIIVNPIFDNYASQSGSTLLIGAIFFAFQIYGDFSGYSDIAIGTSKLFGINLLRNFSYPYFSRDIAEFWRRWHISLTTWFRDYIYIPLGGSRVSKLKVVRNTFIIFLISGFWHGANWTFIAWGLFHALLFLPLILTGKNRSNTNVVGENTIFPSLKEVIQILLTFFVVVIAWVLFRSESITDAVAYLYGMKQLGTLNALYRIFDYKEMWFVLLMIVFEYINRTAEHGLYLHQLNIRYQRNLIYFGIILLIVWFMPPVQGFIYFQF